MSDHSWVHLQIVLNSALRIFRLLRRAGVPPTIQTDYAMKVADAEVVIAGGCLLHDLGMSIHRVDHESFSLFLAADLLEDLLRDVYEEPERTIVASEILHAIIGHRRGGRPLTLEAGIVRVSDALDMEHGRSRVRSRPTCRTSTRCRRPPSTRSGSSRASSARSASRSR